MLCSGTFKTRRGIIERKPLRWSILRYFRSLELIMMRVTFFRIWSDGGHSICMAFYPRSKGLGYNISHASGIFSYQVTSSGGTNDLVTTGFIPVKRKEIDKL
jgi:hypothetical protein